MFLGCCKGSRGLSRLLWRGGFSQAMRFYNVAAYIAALLVRICSSEGCLNGLYQGFRR